jgi:hypothetical protein
MAAEVRSRKIFLEGTMSHCVCGHPEEAHLFGGRCQVPGCMCDRFWRFRRSPFSYDPS